MIRTENWWIEKYKERDAYWTHNGDPKWPHAELTTSKMHSNGFFNSRPIIDDEDLLRDAAQDLMERFVREGGPEYGPVGCIVGPQTGATKLAEMIYYERKKISPSSCSWASPAKHKENGIVTSMVFSEEERAILAESQTVLLCEDVITTGRSVDLTAAAAFEAGCLVLPIVLALVNRSGAKRVYGKRVISLVDRHMPTWDPKDCPLCGGGSKALRPKDNWPELTGQA